MLYEYARWVNPSWDAMNNPGWGTRVWKAVEPDSSKRTGAIAGFNWVFKDVIHRDRIYRLVAGAR